MFRRLGHLFDYWFRRRHLDDDLDEELRSRFETLVEQFVARGLNSTEARRAARLEFESLDQVKEKVRDGLAGRQATVFLQDLRYAWRGMRGCPSFAAIALITLALGIGVNTAVFSVFYAILMRPLPYQQPGRLVRIWANFQSREAARAPVSGGILREIEQRNRAFTGVAGIWIVGPTTFTGDDPVQVKTARVTANFFDLLGVSAARGRTFVREDAGGPATMLSYNFYQRRFGAQDSLIGRRLPMQGTEIAGVSPAANTLVGILPREFQLHFAPDANVPGDVDVFNTFDYGIYQGLTQYYLRLVARLKPGISIEEAQRDLDRVSAEVRGAYTVFGSEGLRFELAGLQDDAFGDVKPALQVLVAGAAFVLLICCVNVASLLLARASDRRREIALRLALGAGRTRIVRQLLAEAGLLSLFGGVAGIGVGWAVFRGLLAIRPERLARVDTVGFQWPVIAFSAAVCIAAALILGLAPALQTFRLDQMEALRASGRGVHTRSHRRAGKSLVVAEIALGFVLVTAAALVARTLANIEQVRPGFEPRRLLTFQLAVAGAFRNPAEFRAWEGELAALPGVEQAGAATHLPFDTDLPNWMGPYRPQGMPDNVAPTVAADLRPVTPGFLPAMGVRLLEGRYFDQGDRANNRLVVIVDESLARSAWPGESAIGKWIDAEHVLPEKGFQTVRSVVVGVAEHVHGHSLTGDVRSEIYMPFEQSPRSPVTFVLRTRGDPLSVVTAVRASLRRHAPNSAIAKIRPMTDYVNREIDPVSFTAVLAAFFAGLALVLAATGIYGVLNYQISRRMPEMGVRMAVGARPRDVLGLVLREGIIFSAIGVLLGLAGTELAARWLGTLLYGVSPHDPLSYGVALLLLPAAAVLGCWRPAWRAASVNPVEIIREE